MYVMTSVDKLCFDGTVELYFNELLWSHLIVNQVSGTSLYEPLLYKTKVFEKFYSSPFPDQLRQMHAKLGIIGSSLATFSLFC